MKIIKGVKGAKRDEYFNHPAYVAFGAFPFTVLLPSTLSLFKSHLDGCEWDDLES